jgi:hypothetical protein
MIVPITSEWGDLVEWGLVELQGKVEHREGAEEDEALHIGTLALSGAVSCARGAPGVDRSSKVPS